MANKQSFIAFYIVSNAFPGAFFLCEDLMIAASCSSTFVLLRAFECCRGRSITKRLLPSFIMGSDGMVDAVG
jgi:hypothetical protein